jgi:uncharacterized damage-inducible protein DinB
MPVPDWRSILCEGFDYDRFANALWLPYILGREAPEASAVFHHILSASEIWVTRLGGVSLPAMPEVPVTQEALDGLHNRWIEVLKVDEYDREVSYTNTRGMAFVRKVGDIARHVVHHGTYHRGQIRQMFGAKEIDFPETDFIGFAFHRDG